VGAHCDLCHTLPPSAADRLLAWIEPAVLESDRARLTSPIALWETVAGLCRSHIFSAESARNRVKGLCDLFGLKIVGIGEREYDLALQACAEFGQGRHPAALNMGDCFAYACARAHGAALLFKGEDFSRTDVLMARVGDL
jgi:ribonuclease VapC